jgi:ATP-binding cassette, subfamily A (ABC1), member 3
MFGVIESNKDRLKIQEYSIAQTSLEQIFNQFAALQDEERGAAAGISPVPVLVDAQSL